MGKIRSLWHLLREQQKSIFDYFLELTIFLYPVVSFILHTKIDPSDIRNIVFEPSFPNFINFIQLFQINAQVYTDLMISIILMFMRLGVLLLAYSAPIFSKILGGFILAFTIIILFWTNFQSILVERFMADQMNYRFALYAVIIHVTIDVVKASILKEPV